MTHASKWLVMIVLGLAGTVIYLLPFLREVYYHPLQQALGLTNTQVGVLTSVFGATSMIAYLPGGWLADRVAPRLLISASLISTGLLGFIFATFPSYPMALAIHGLWGVTITGMMWGALIKATSDWAPPEQQGRAFGLLEAGRGVSEAAIYTGFLKIFEWLGKDSSALSSIIIQYSLLHIALGVIAWRVISPGKPVSPVKGSAQSSALVTVLKMPAVWMISIVLMTGYCGYWGAYYFTPYASDVFAMSAVAAGAIAAGKVWLKPIAAAAAGFIADRVGIWRSVAFCFAVLFASFAAFTLIPGRPSLIPLMIANIVLASVLIFALRGIYFALLEESGVPAAAIGTATGVVSMIGFTPDIFMPLVGGALLDQYPGRHGYQLYFGFIAGLCVAGLIAALVIGRLAHRRER